MMSTVMAVHKKMLINMMLAVFLLLAVSSAVKGQYIIDAPYGSTPTIDGTIESEEWSDAYTFTFNNTDVYVKQDGKSLYVGLIVEDYRNGGVAFFIDVDHDGGSTPQMDDILFGVYRNGTPFEMRDDQDQTPPTGGWSVAVQNLTETWMAEYNITYTKIGVTAGEEKTLGIIFESFGTLETPFIYFWPPITAMEATSPSNWGDLTSEVNWIPEFPSAIILPLFTVLTMLAIVFAKRRFSRKLKT